MIILGILIIILLLCVFKHIFYSNKETFESKENLLLNNDFRYSNIIRKMSESLYNKLSNVDMVELKCELKHKCNDYSNYITKSEHEHPWTLHFKYLDTETITHKKGVTTFKINNNKCYIYSYTNNIKLFDINNYYQICITAKSENSKIKIKPYLSNSYTDENNELIYEKNIKFSKITNKEIIWVYYLKDSTYNSLNWYIENGANSEISLSNPCISKIENIETFLNENKEIVVTDLVKCSINKFLIKSDDSIINEIKDYIKIIYINKSKNPDNFSKYSNLVNEKVKNIKSKSDLKKLLKMLLQNIKCTNTIKPIVAYHVFLYNKYNPNNKISDNKDDLDNDFINYIEWGDNFLNDEESKSIELLIIEIISNFENNNFSAIDLNKNNEIFERIYTKNKTAIKTVKDFENIITVIFEYLTIENLKFDKNNNIYETPILKNWDNLIETPTITNEIRLQFLQSNNDSILNYMVDDFLHSLVYIILKIIYKIMNKELILKSEHINLINEKIILLLKNSNISEEQLYNIINK